MNLVNRCINRIYGIIKLYILRIAYCKKLTFNNILKVRIGKSFKVVIGDSKSKVVFGDNLSFRDYVNLRTSGGKISIGNNVFFNNFVSINCMDEINIGDDCLFGENVKIYDHDHVFDKKILIRNQGFKSKPINIGRNVWIGSNCAILKGITIGDNVVVGAGTIVREDIPNNTIIKTDFNLSCSKIRYKNN